jgi:hypothetical protein
VSGQRLPAGLMLPDLSDASDEALLAGLEHLLAELERRATEATLLGLRAGARLDTSRLSPVHVLRPGQNGGPQPVSDKRT